MNTSISRRKYYIDFDRLGGGGLVKVWCTVAGLHAEEGGYTLQRRQDNTMIRTSGSLPALHYSY